MPAFLNLSGQKFSRLLVIKPTDRRAGGNVIFECLCDCGRTAFVSGDKLKNGNNRSCGCSKVERFYKHGLARHPLYHAWHGLVSRCTDPTHPQWTDYGGRGITVCPEWLGDNGLTQFVADMDPKPPGTSIDRIDNEGPYSAQNCRWATTYEQQSNTRANVRISYLGRTMIVEDWARELGLRSDTLRHRLITGRPLSEILSSKRLTRSVTKLSRSHDPSRLR
jgi:hypothetical protein